MGEVLNRIQPYRGLLGPKLNHREWYCGVLLLRLVYCGSRHILVHLKGVKLGSQAVKQLEDKQT